VHDILAIVDAEGDEAASKAEAKDEETNAKQPAETTSLINGGCCDGGVARGANAHDGGGTEADGLHGHDSGDGLSCYGSGSRGGISDGLWGGCSCISDGGGGWLARRHLSGIGIHGGLVGISVTTVVHFRSGGHVV